MVFSRCTTPAPDHARRAQTQQSARREREPAAGAEPRARTQVWCPELFVEEQEPAAEGRDGHGAWRAAPGIPAASAGCGAVASEGRRAAHAAPEPRQNTLSVRRERAAAAQVGPPGASRPQRPAAAPARRVRPAERVDARPPPSY
jgi:hypothetical protein